ncbi:MAG: hypothetical protein HY696_06355 [Deltaproteobacteria bacterium]|nr:hypothetical protein [Deltaproteobacteria bacterium]
MIQHRTVSHAHRVPLRDAGDWRRPSTASTPAARLKWRALENGFRTAALWVRRVGQDALTQFRAPIDAVVQALIDGGQWLRGPELGFAGVGGTYRTPSTERVFDGVSHILIDNGDSFTILSVSGVGPKIRIYTDTPLEFSARLAGMGFSDKGIAFQMRALHLAWRNDRLRSDLAVMDHPDLPANWRATGDVCYVHVEIDEDTGKLLKCSPLGAMDARQVAILRPWD